MVTTIKKNSGSQNLDNLVFNRSWKKLVVPGLCKMLVHYRSWIALVVLGI